MKPLESRKQLLLAESDLNRACLVGDLNALTAEVCTLAHRATSLDSIASSAAVLMTGLGAYQRGKHARTDLNHSRLQSLLDGAVLVSTVWLAFRSQPGDSGAEKAQAAGMGKTPHTA